VVNQQANEIRRFSLKLIALIYTKQHSHKYCMRALQKELKLHFHKHLAGGINPQGQGLS
jgi:hypothetical protein